MVILRRGVDHGTNDVASESLQVGIDFPLLFMLGLSLHSSSVIPLLLCYIFLISGERCSLPLNFFNAPLILIAMKVILRGLTRGQASRAFATVRVHLRVLADMIAEEFIPFEAKVLCQWKMGRSWLRKGI